MNLEFLPEAQAEFFAAADYYADKDSGLGKRFRAEIGDTCATISAHPLLWREREGGFRRVNCPVFPYYIAYYIRGTYGVSPCISMSIHVRKPSPSGSAELSLPLSEPRLQASIKNPCSRRPGFFVSVSV